MKTSSFIPAHGRACGSVLLLSLWALLLLSAAVLAWVGFIDRHIAFARESSLGLEARALAYSGLSLALHPQVKPSSPLLRQEFARDRAYEVALLGEGGRLNINWLLAGEDPRKLDLFRAWLERRGLGFREREVLIDSLLDWVDADNVRRLNGLEDAPGYRAPNRPLQSVEEIRQVAGSEALTLHPGWEDEITVMSQGPIDLLAADQNVLAILPGIGDPRAERFLQFRRGGDEKDNTEDDPEFENITQVRSFLGLSEAQFQVLSPLVTIRDNTWRVESVGRAGDLSRQLEVVARKVGQRAQILSWKEL